MMKNTTPLLQEEVAQNQDVFNIPNLGDILPKTNTTKPIKKLDEKEVEPVEHHCHNNRINFSDWCFL